jgi:hypothetical protein
MQKKALEVTSFFSGSDSSMSNKNIFFADA